MSPVSPRCTYNQKLLLGCKAGLNKRTKIWLIFRLKWYIIFNKGGVKDISECFRAINAVLMRPEMSRNRTDMMIKWFCLQGNFGKPGRLQKLNAVAVRQAQLLESSVRFRERVSKGKLLRHRRDVLPYQPTLAPRGTMARKK